MAGQCNGSFKTGVLFTCQVVVMVGGGGRGGGGEGDQNEGNVKIIGRAETRSVTAIF